MSDNIPKKSLNQAKTDNTEESANFTPVTGTASAPEKESVSESTSTSSLSSSSSSSNNTSSTSNVTSASSASSSGATATAASTDTDNDKQDKVKGPSLVEKVTKFGITTYEYFWTGIWADNRNKWWVKLGKVVNLSIRSFLDGDLQNQACAMTYRTLLAIVPALALLFAIGRGFGFQALLEKELFTYFPAQHIVITDVLQFVDSYLKQASEGIFVGVGLVFLLWTLISLVSSVEDRFNAIWGILQGRSLWRKITDYTAMLLILPVLMICASGLSLMLSNTIQKFFNWTFITPLLDAVLELGSYAFTWLFFSAMYMLIPNTKVDFKNAFIAGIFCGTGFQILQWLFVTGQIYVSKYNAIYGSFSFLPLLLLWMQLAWTVCLAGAVLCYSLQNVLRFNLINKVSDLSLDYRERVAMAMMTVITQNFEKENKLTLPQDFVDKYAFPSRVSSELIHILIESNLIHRVIIDEKKLIFGLAPAIDASKLTVGYVQHALAMSGLKNFIPHFYENFPGVNQILDKMEDAIANSTDKTSLNSLDINLTPPPIQH